MFIAIKWIKGRPYKYQLRSVWDKEKKRPKLVYVRYFGRASVLDLAKYYKGAKTYDFRRKDDSGGA